MASNYTENFGLCQWEATDQVLRTDFNKDNVKIDDALKSSAQALEAEKTAWEHIEQRVTELEGSARAVLISSGNVPDQSPTFSIPLELDWSEWYTVAIVFDPHTKGQGMLNIYAGDGETQFAKVPSNEDTDLRHLYCLRVLLFPFHSAYGQACGIDLYSGEIHSAAGAFSELTSLRVECPEDCYLISKSTFQIWGMK